MILALGDFLFEALGTGYQSVDRNTDWRIAEHKRIGARPLLQFVGENSDKITIDGVCYPQLTEGASRIERLRTMAEAGQNYVLLDQWGWVYGLWVIQAVKEKQTMHMRGQAQKIEFTLSLMRDDDDAYGASSEVWDALAPVRSVVGMLT
jgi:hypothetical protein